jgi:hypothetical protein
VNARMGSYEPSSNTTAAVDNDRPSSVELHAGILTLSRIQATAKRQLAGTVGAFGFVAPSATFSSSAWARTRYQPIFRNPYRRLFCFGWRIEGTV